MLGGKLLPDPRLVPGEPLDKHFQPPPPVGPTHRYHAAALAAKPAAPPDPDPEHGRKFRSPALVVLNPMQRFRTWLGPKDAQLAATCAAFHQRGCPVFLVRTFCPDQISTN